jgi:epoxyqueuosine reductase QueG
MTILRHKLPKVPTPENTTGKRLDCDMCGCIYIAEPEEIREEKGQFKSNCPECNACCSWVSRFDTQAEMEALREKKLNPVS